MPRLTLRYLTSDDGRTVVLLTDGERLRLRAAADDLRRRALRLDAEGCPAEAIGARLQAYAAEDEILIDGELSGLDEARSLTIAYREATIADRDAVRQALRDTGGDVLAAKAAAVARLAPREENAPEGQAIPLPFVGAVEEACYAAIDPNPSEERRFFSIRRRAA